MWHHQFQLLFNFGWVYTAPTQLNWNLWQSTPGSSCPYYFIRAEPQTTTSWLGFTLYQMSAKMRWKTGSKMHKTKQQKWFFPKETILQKRKRRKLLIKSERWQWGLCSPPVRTHLLATRLSCQSHLHLHPLLLQHVFLITSFPTSPWWQPLPW